MTVKPRVSGSSKPSAASIGDSDGGFAPPPSAPIQVSGGLDLRRLRSFKGVWLFLRQIRGQVWGGSSGDESGEWSFIVLSLFFVVSYYSPVVEIEHLLPLVGWFLLHSVYFHPNHMDNPIIVCLFSSTGSGLGLICSPLGEFWAIKISQFGKKKKKEPRAKVGYCCMGWRNLLVFLSCHSPQVGREWVAVGWAWHGSILSPWPMDPI